MSPLDLIPAQYRVAAELAVLAVALAAAGACGWMVNGWRLESRNAHDREAFAQERAKALGVAVAARDVAIKDRDALAGKLAAIDAASLDNLRRFEHANDTLAARADAGTVRVRVVGAACPAAHDVPQAAAPAGVDSGTGAELGPDARRRYFALRGALGHAVEQLAACQSAARAMTGQ